LIKIIKFIPPYSETKIKKILLLGTLGTNLIYIPMFGVTYRIFLVFKMNSLKINIINDRQLLIGVISIISLSFIFNLVIVLTKRFFLQNY